MNTTSDLISAIRARQAEIASSLAGGMATTWESYQRLVGQNQGLQEALDILNSLLKDRDEDE